MKARQRSLMNWSKQNWRTKSGKKSSETGERYLPEKAIKALTSVSGFDLAVGLRLSLVSVMYVSPFILQTISWL